MNITVIIIIIIIAIIIGCADESYCTFVITSVEAIFVDNDFCFYVIRPKRVGMKVVTEEITVRGEV